MKGIHVMVKTLGIASVAALVVFLGQAPLRAHHSLNAEFDTQHEIVMKGVLTKVDNVNPHSWWFVDVKDANGHVTSWKLEALAPAGLIRQGLKVKSELKMGEEYSFRIHPALKDPGGDQKLGFMKAITVNGKEYIVIEA
jgi:hypothetical protein